MRIDRTIVLGILLGSLSTSATRADLFTVGPGGSHATIQGAIDAALATPSGDTIRIASGTYFERLDVPSTLSASIEISGGWDPGYVSQSGDRDATVIDAGGLGRGLRIECAAGSVRVSNLRITGGRTGPTGRTLGGGVWASAQGTCSLGFDRLLLDNNRAERDAPVMQAAAGGGMALVLLGSSTASVSDCRFVENVADNPLAGSGASGGGFWAVPSQSSSLEVRGSRFSENSASSVTAASGGGLTIHLANDARLTLLDLEVSNNEISAPSEAGSGVVVSGSPSCELCRASARRLSIRSNRGSIRELAQLWIPAQEGSDFEISDSILADGNAAGLDVQADGTTRVDLTNLTVAHHPDQGITLAAVSSESVISLYNTISAFNVGDLVTAGPGVLDLGSNLIGVDPRFVGAGDLRLGAGSPGIDAGNPSPPAGLGPADVALQPRVQGTRVDVGAHEARPGDSVCQVQRFGPLPRVPGFAPACFCFRSAALRSFRCAVLTPELALGLELPDIVTPGQFAQASWSLESWTGLQGQVAIQAEAIGEGESLAWRVQPNRSKLNGRVGSRHRGKGPVPFGVPVLRTTISSVLDGGGLVETLVEVLLPVEDGEPNPDQP